MTINELKLIQDNLIWIHEYLVETVGEAEKIDIIIRIINKEIIRVESTN